jgi:hypothetical protein
MERKEIIESVKNRIRPVLGPAWKYAQRAKARYESLGDFDVPIEKLLRGGENGIRAARYAELTGELLRPSTPTSTGPHVDLLRQHERLGDELFAPGVFEKTAYYRNAVQCMRLTGDYFLDDHSQLRVVAQRFVSEYRNEGGESAKPILVLKIRHSSYFELMDGSHRVARAIMAGKMSLRARLYEKEPALTPLQSLLLDVLWINRRRELYQPLDYPELRDGWKLIRKCADRFAKMRAFLSEAGLLKLPGLTSVDLGSSYGWFVKSFGELGFQAIGVERDPIGRAVGFHCYGIRPEQIQAGDIACFLRMERKRYDVVSLLSVLHHYVRGNRGISPEALIRLADKITGRVLFLDTGEAREEGFVGSLSKWTPPFIAAWLKKNTSFTKIVALGKDEDRVPGYPLYGGRTLFACVRD